MPKVPGLDALLEVRPEPCRPANYPIGSQPPASRHEEGGRRVTAAARDRPETAPTAADTYLTRQSSAAETPPPRRARACAWFKPAGPAAQPSGSFHFRKHAAGS